MKYEIFLNSIKSFDYFSRVISIKFYLDDKFKKFQPIQMLRLTQKDYNFFLLCSFIKTPPPDSTKLVKAVQTFRSKLSLKWLDLVLEDENPVECLKYVWLVLFKISTHEDATVRVSVYNAIGGLLFTMLPFSPHHIMNSFSEATQEYKITTRASICIVSSFLYICHFISPSDLEDFVTNTPVIPHFGVDVSSFIQYIPKFVRLMKPLDVQFHKVLLRSLLSSFGRKPNHDFVKSVVSLVALNPEVLIKDLMEFIISNSLNQTILAIGPQILLNDNIFELLSENYISQFLDASLSVLSNTESILSDFEQACGTLSILCNRYKGEKLENLKEKIKKNTLQDDGLTLKEYPKHFNRLLLQLPTPIEDLQINPNDLNSIKCAKINALVNYARKTDDRKPVLLMLSKLNDFTPSGDVLTSLINSMQPLFPLLLQKNFDVENFRKENKILSDLLRSILIRNDMTWLQKVSVLNLLLSIGIDLGNKLIEDFESIVIPLILEFACSPQNELSSVATSTLGQFVNLNNVSVVKSFLWSVNYFDPMSALPFIVILNIIADSLGHEELTEFCGIVCELIIFYPNEPEIAGNAFNFLEKCHFYEDVPNAVISACIDWITRLYLSITQNSSKVSSPLKNEPLTPLISTVETDVVASDLLDIRFKLLPLLYCYKFFISLKGILSPYCLLFTKELTRIFPDAIIPTLLNIPLANIKSDFAEMPEMICSILKSAKTLETASDCCEFLFNFASNECLLSQKDLVQFFVKNPKVVDGKYLYQFYRFLMKVNPSKSDELLSIITGKLDDVNLAIFEMKLGTFSIEKFKKFRETIKFEDWPETVLHFFKEHSKLSSEESTEKENDFDFMEELNDEQLALLDFPHFSFFFHNKERFIVDPQVYENYTKHHRHFLMKLEFHYVEKKFTFKPLEEAISKEPTFLTQILNSLNNNGQITATSDALVRSFFMHTKFRVTQKVIDDIIGQINSPQAATLLVQYTDKFKFTVTDEQFLSLIRSIQKVEYNESEFESFLIVVAKKLSKEKINEFEELLSDKKKTASCLDFPSSLKLWYDADNYLNELRSELFLNGEEVVIKSKKLRTFSKILSQSPKFDGNELFSFLSTVILPSIPTCSSSSKKLISILRVLNESVTLHKKEVPPQFLKELIEKITSLQSSSIPLVFHEFSMLFSVLFEISEHTELFTFCESFDKVVTKTAVFIVPQSVALSRYSDHLVSNRVTKSGLNDQLSIEIPSQRLHVIRAIDTLLNNRSYWPLMVQVLSNVVKTYQEFSNRPFFDQALVKFSTILSSDVNFESVRNVFTQKILPFFFVEPRQPSFAVFAEAASVATQQIAPPLPIYSSFIERIVKTKPIEPNAGHYYREFVQWLLKYEKDPVRRSDILLEELSVMQKIYAADPSIENSEGLIEAIHQPSEGIDVILLLFGKVAVLNISRLQIVVLIHKYYRNASQEERENCRAIFESLSDSYGPETAKAIKMVLDGKPFEAALC